MPLVCRCGHQLESHRPPKLMPCTSTRLGEPLDEKLEKICTRPGEIVCEEHVREVVWVAPVAPENCPAGQLYRLRGEYSVQIAIKF